LSIDEKGRVISLFEARTAARTKVIERLRSKACGGEAGRQSSVSQEMTFGTGRV
jgi:hypothetical protein